MWVQMGHGTEFGEGLSDAFGPTAPSSNQFAYWDTAASRSLLLLFFRSFCRASFYEGCLSESPLSGLPMVSFLGTPTQWTTSKTLRSLKASIGFLGDVRLEKRRALAVYPLGLFYFVLGWIVLVSPSLFG